MEASGVEVVHGGVDSVERVRPRVELHFALRGQHHQLGEVVVTADQIANDASLAGDDVDGRDVDRAAVPDDEVGAGPSRQVPAQRLRPLLRNKIENDIGALAIGQFQNFLGRTVVC